MKFKTPPILIDETGRERLLHLPPARRAGRIPGWVRSRLCQSLGLRGLSRHGNILEQARQKAEERAAEIAGTPGLFFNAWFDHLGSATYTGCNGEPVQAFVVEPYHVEGPDLLAVSMFAKLIGARVKIEGIGSHYPGVTVRIVFWLDKEAKKGSDNEPTVARTV